MDRLSLSNRQTTRFPRSGSIGTILAESKTWITIKETMCISTKMKKNCRWHMSDIPNPKQATSAKSIFINAVTVKAALIKVTVSKGTTARHQWKKEIKYFL